MASALYVGRLLSLHASSAIRMSALRDALENPRALRSATEASRAARSVRYIDTQMTLYGPPFMLSSRGRSDGGVGSGTAKLTRTSRGARSAFGAGVGIDACGVAEGFRRSYEILSASLFVRVRG